LTTSQLDYHATLRGPEKKIQEDAEGVSGPDKAIARVSADMDFQQVNITEERYDPSTVIRSEQKTLEKSSSTTGRNREDKEGLSPQAAADSKAFSNQHPPSSKTLSGARRRKPEYFGKANETKIMKSPKSINRSAAGIIKNFDGGDY
jgi:flagellar M-ring protein FliF